MALPAGAGFFCRPGRMSLRAVPTGSFVCANVGCAVADAASKSNAGITIVLIRFFSSCMPCRPQRHRNANTFLAMLLLTEQYAAKNQCFAGKVTCGVRNETSGQSWPSNTVATDPFTGQNRNSKWQRYPAQSSG